MARNGFGKVITAIARESARQQRLSATAHRRRTAAEKRAQAEQRREHLRLEKEMTARSREQAREAKAAYLQSREDEVVSRNEDIERQLEDLTNILGSTLSVDDSIDFESLRIRDRAPSFSAPSHLQKPADPPRQEHFVEAVRPPSGLGKLFPGAQGRYRKAVEAAKEAFEIAYVEWQGKENRRQTELAPFKAQHEQALKDHNAKKAMRDAEVDSFQASYDEAEPEAIVAYNSMVLERSDYPEGFPQNFSVAYMKASKQLVVEYELPARTLCHRRKSFDMRSQKTRSQRLCEKAQN
jgi:restriction system protein